MATTTSSSISVNARLLNRTDLCWRIVPISFQGIAAAARAEPRPRNSFQQRWRHPKATIDYECVHAKMQECIAKRLGFSETPCNSRVLTNGQPPCGRPASAGVRAAVKEENGISGIIGLHGVRTAMESRWEGAVVCEAQRSNHATSANVVVSSLQDSANHGTVNHAFNRHRLELNPAF